MFRIPDMRLPFHLRLERPPTPSKAKINSLSFNHSLFLKWATGLRIHNIYFLGEFNSFRATPVFRILLPSQRLWDGG